MKSAPEIAAAAATPTAASAKRASSLRERILFALLGYVLLLTVVVIAQGFFAHERAERLVWEAMLTSELDDAVERMHRDPDYRWIDTHSMVLYDPHRGTELPAPLRGLAPGMHDDVVVGDRIHVVLVRQVDDRPLVLALDITDFERSEVDTALLVAGSTAGLLVLLGLVVAWAASRLVRPLGQLAQDIGALRPDQHGQHVPLPTRASSELQVIRESVNDYLQRQDRFVERERKFIATASHELRTPMAVIAGATELALQQHDLAPTTHHQLTRIQRTAGEVERLIALLLVLAKDPARLAQSSDHIALDRLLPRIVEDHLYLTEGKTLGVSLGALPPCAIDAPMPIVQAAIGNLLRNAIESSDRGEIVVRLETPATVVIEDPGHGMSPEEISAIYARVARGGGNGDDGIGLDLIARLCEHLGWALAFTSQPERGTTTTLTFPT
ncbi:sensor histidine kinase [Agrilutibacter solisilvae]|uniref:histidine kinase n=1 Tax=Agrilutibacter solisilvae TaxID=2763317 RepID=A0A974Y067_9GAMM|nr:HAMP domain-containing sensor histidine kinase [Lysobacter solisilvae]QSX78996.1 HAMP domain-containing histidine kinase [Lysobacter solisilvae]